MTTKTSLQTSSRTPKGPQTLEQQRFQFLIRQIGDARKAFSDLEKRIEAFRQLRVKKLQPVRASLTRALRETIFAIDRLLDQRGWSRAEQAALRNILTGTAEIVIEVAGEDPEIKAVYNKHSNVDFDTAKDEDIQRLKAEAEASTGFDLGGDGDIRSEEDLVQRLYEEMAARETAEERDAPRPPKPSKRSEDNAKLAQQALRDIYRKLASAVHPDRESDAARREEKNALMQRINQAYAENDLLALFEIQIEVDQLDPEQIGDLGTQRLRHYNRLLSEQLEQLRGKLQALEASAGADDEADFEGGIGAHNLEMRLRRQARGLRAEVTRQEQLLKVLADKAATKRWLKQQRQFAKRDDDEAED